MRTRSISGFLVVAVLASGLSALSLPSSFAESSDVLEEVVVTARKVEESLQDVSIAVTALTGDQVDELMIRDVRELEGLVPNVVIDAVSVAPAGASLYIRGVGTQEVERSFDPAVGVVIDGVPLSFVNGSMRNTFDFESIEILRGPQGTLFGRNTTGGVLNIRRTLPTGEFGLKYEIRSGTDDLLDTKAVFNFPLGEMLAGKVSFASQRDGSPRENDLLRKGVGNADNQEWSASLLFTPSENLDALFTYVRYDDENDGIPLQNIASFNGPSNSVNPAPDLPCLLGFCGSDVTDIESFSQDFYTRDVDFQWDSYALNVNYDVNVGTISAIFGFQETEESVPTDFDATPLNFFHTLRDQESEQTTAEIRFASSPELSDQFDFVAGLFWVEDEYQLSQITSIAAFGGQAGALFQNPNADHEREAWAVFGELHIDLSDRFMLTLGGRYTEEEKDYSGMIFFGGDPIAGHLPGSPVDDLFVFGQPIWVPIDSAMGDATWEEFTPKIGLDFRLNDNVLTYISYSEGFRSGGFNGRNQNLANIGPFDPEFVENWEIGMKGDFFNNTLRLNLAAFTNKYDDKQEEIIEPDGFGGSNTVVRNASTADLMGWEAEMVWVASDRLRIDANVGYLDAEYDDFLADLTGTGTITDNSGLGIRRTPEWTYGVSGNYTVPIGAGYFNFYASYRYTDEYWVEVRNDPRGLLDDRGVIDVVASYEWDLSENRTVKISLWGRDVTDEVEFQSAVTIPGTIAFAGVGGGEQFGVTIGGNF